MKHADVDAAGAYRIAPLPPDLSFEVYVTDPASPDQKALGPRR